MKKKNIITIVLVFVGSLFKTVKLPAMFHAAKSITSLKIINKTPLSFWRAAITPKGSTSSKAPIRLIEIRPHSKTNINQTLLFLEILLSPHKLQRFAVGNEITSLIFEQENHNLSLRFVYADPIKSTVIPLLPHPVEPISDSYQEESGLNFYDDPCIIS